MKKTIYWLLAVFLLFAACNNDRVPRNKLVKILVEMYLYENEIPLALGIRADSAHIHYSVFTKYDITKAQFDSTLHYYSTRPKELKSIYESVNKRLVAIKDKADERIALADKESNLWKGDNKYTFQRDGKPKTVDFEVEITETGIYEIRATARYYADDSTNTPHMSAFLISKNTPDSIDKKRVNFVREKAEREYTMTFHIADSSITRMAGYWLNVDNSDKKNIQHIQIHKLQIKRTGNIQNTPTMEIPEATDTTTLEDNKDPDFSSNGKNLRPVDRVRIVRPTS